MKTAILILGTWVSLLIAGCSTPQGGIAQNGSSERSVTGTGEGTAPATMATPDMPSGSNPRDLRDPQSVTFPRAPEPPKQ